MATEVSTSKAWQLATIVVPVILTAWLTFVSSRSQDNISQKIAANQQILSAQLSLTTELFKRRFDSYEVLYAQLINLNNKLLIQRANNAADERLKPKNDERLAASNRQTADLLSQLSELNAANALHMSDDVSALMSNAWKAGVDGDTDTLSKKITEVEAQMKKELNSEMENKTLPAGNAPAAPAAH
jgi:hypothetical protein